MPEVRPVTKDNWNELIELKVREDQTHFVASNLYSIAESQFGYDEPDGATGICIHSAFTMTTARRSAS
ncbi:MAG TPA: hypothetical protein VI524_09775 [Anaerolineales bacterium]|nr:hypothetical protein [Anaerolineales bacterium]